MATDKGRFSADHLKGPLDEDPSFKELPKPKPPERWYAQDANAMGLWLQYTTIMLQTVPGISSETAALRADQMMREAEARLKPASNLAVVSAMPPGKM